MIQKMKNIYLLAAILLTGCDTFKEKVILSGKRENILSIDTTILPDPEVEKLPIVLPPNEKNRDWPQAGGNPYHLMPNLALDKPLQETWRTSAGSGASEDHRLTSGPIVGDGYVYASDAMGNVTAVNIKDGSIAWTVNTSPEENTSEAMGSGVAFDNGTVFCASAFGELLALNAKDGKVIWRKSLGAPSRVSPTIRDGKVYALTINNEVQVYTTKTGDKVWNHAGISEAAGILGGASPAIADGIVIAAYSSGEVFALQSNTGQILWNDLLNPALRIDSVASIAHIRARPVISGNTVYIVSHGGQMVAFDLKTGSRLWQREVGGIRSPAVIGDSIFVVSNDSELVCMKKSTGQIHWAVPLPKTDNDKKAVLWAGPIVADDSLVLTGSNGQLLFASAKNGKTMKVLDMPSGSSISPIVANGALYVLTDDAYLVKYSSEEKK